MICWEDWNVHVYFIYLTYTYPGLKTNILSIIPLIIYIHLFVYIYMEYIEYISVNVNLYQILAYLVLNKHFILDPAQMHK